MTTIEETNGQQAMPEKKLTAREKRLLEMQKQLQNREAPPELVPPIKGMPVQALNTPGGQAQNRGVDRSESQQSLYQVIEVPIIDILDSPYQTRESISPARFARMVKSMQVEKPTEFKDAIPVRAHPTEAGKWQVARGGHTRLKAALAAGLTTYPIIVVEYNDKRSALGIARENLARGDEYTPVEEGKLFLLLRSDFGFTQEGLAEELEIDRDHIKECEAAAQSAPDILEMFRRLKELGAEANHGLRAAKCLRRLDVWDKREKGLAAKLRAPFIDLFVLGALKTDTLDIVTKKIVDAEDPEITVAKILRELNPSEESVTPSTNGEADPATKVKEQPTLEIHRSERLNLTVKKFRLFSKLMGDTKPNEDERRVLKNLREEIDILLNR